MTTSPKSPPPVSVENLPGPDFTTYVKSLQLEIDDPTPPPAIETQPKKSTEEANPEVNVNHDPKISPRKKKPRKSYDGSFLIEHGGSSSLARGLACRAYEGSYWSVTLRCDHDNRKESSDQYEKGLVDYVAEHELSGTKPQKRLGYCPIGYQRYAELFSYQEPAAPQIFLNNIYQVCFELYNILLANRAVTPTGLLTLTGATDSSKSLIIRGLIFLHLEAAAREALAQKLRRPHLVTFEDPIEQYYVKDSTGHSAPTQPADLEKVLAALNLDYTPRARGTDATSLSKVIKDAKRQTPAVLFVGETRDWRDWKDLLDFGGSGHLVVTTSHAGSVVEAMTQIFKNTKTQTPSQRSELARRILGIINVRTLNPTISRNDGKAASNVRALLPAVWKRTSQSMNNLVADGLSSILPALDREHELGYYGRTYFARRLIKDEPITQEFKDCDDSSLLAREIVRKAQEWDIGGV